MERAEFEQKGKGSGELAVEGGFVALGEIEHAGVISEVAEDDGGPNGWGIGGVVLAGHFEIEAGFLDAPDAHLTPAGDGHGFDERGFGGVAGMELEGEGG